jgi:hypothetical protein
MFFDQNKGVMNPSFFKVLDFLWDGCEKGTEETGTFKEN